MKQFSAKDGAVPTTSTRRDISMVISKTYGIPQALAYQIIDTTFETLLSNLIENGHVELRGFGVLSVRTRKPRLARNPKTGAKVEVAEKRVPFFKAGKNINAALNKKK